MHQEGPLCMLSCKRVRAEIGLRGFQEPTDATVFLKILLPLLFSQLGWGNIESLLLSLHTSPLDFPSSEAVYQGNTVVLKVSFVGDSFCG